MKSPGKPADDKSSPCNNLCRYTTLEGTPTCEGCGRTYDDLSNWMYLDKEGKREVILRCKDNLKKLAKN